MRTKDLQSSVVLLLLASGFCLLIGEVFKNDSLIMVGVFLAVAAFFVAVWKAVPPKSTPSLICENCCKNHKSTDVKITTNSMGAAHWRCPSCGVKQRL